MEVQDSLIKLLKALHDNMGNERIPYEAYSHETLGLEYPMYNRLIEMAMEEGLVKGFIEVRVLGQSYAHYKAMTPAITLRGIQFLESNM